jgi:putative addiction module killer protein
MIEVRQTATYTKWFARMKDVRAKARIDIRIRRLSLGNPGDVKPVGKGVSELRLDVGKGYRIYFIHRGEQLIILLAGGDKSTQQKDIERAIKIAGEI